MRKITSSIAVGIVGLSLMGATGCQEPVRERVVYREPPPRLPPPPPAYRPDMQAAPSADVDDFRDDLALYGQWVQTPEYGLVWIPASVAPDWRPYTVGQWAYTPDYGWLWVSDEPWGWATYHYGWWVMVDHRGWCWVPGHEWGPGWVAWRSGGGYIGWAPLPPRRGVSIDLQISDVEVRNIPPSHFCFVEERFITEHRVFEHAVPVVRNTTIVNVTQNVTKYERVNNHIVNRSVDVEHVERVTGKTVQRYNIAESNSVRKTEIRGNQIVIRRPAAASEQARQRLEQRHQEERTQMEERHRRELGAAPPEQRAPIAARHEHERGAMEERWQRESRPREQ